MRKLMIAVASMLLAVAAAGAGLAQAPAPIIRALFVGINRYDQPGIDLKGAVNDVVLIRQGLTDAKVMTPNPPPSSGACQVADDVSPTLLDACATRRNIIDAWKHLIDASNPGDTLIFYYSGHGSTTGQAAFEEGGQVMDTIVPADARAGPGGASGAGDLLGTEIKTMVDAATDRGRNVVTIFDSCDSGAATRDIDHPGVREIPPAPDSVQGDAPDMSTLAAKVADTPGYAVHLAATNRSETAEEKTWPNPRQDDGDFTRALAAALAANPTASYADMAAAAMTWLAANGVKQHPQAEGAILAAFGESGADAGRLYPARWDGKALTARAGLTADAAAVGRLGGVTSNSTYKVYVSGQDAVRDRNALGQAVVNPGATATAATLTPTGFTPPDGLLWMREIKHDFGGATLRLRVRDPLPAETVAALSDMDLLDSHVGAGQAADFELRSTAPDHWEIWRIDGAAAVLAVNVDQVDGDTTAAKIAEAVRRLANYRALRDMADASPSSLGGLWTQSPCDPNATRCSSLVYGRSKDDAQCQPDPVAAPNAAPASAASLLRASQTGAAPGTAIMPAGAAFAIYARNLSCRDLHPYVFYLGSDYSITLLYPPPGSADWVLRNQVQLVRTGHAVRPTQTGGPELGRLILIMSDTAIPAEALEQSGLPRGITCQASALAQLLCSARTGKRTLDSGVQALGQWSATTLAIQVKAP